MTAVVRVAERGQFFATRDSARRLVAERVDTLPPDEKVLLDWTGVQAVTGAFAAEFVKWEYEIAGRRWVGSVHMSADVFETYETAIRRRDALEMPSADEPGTLSLVNGSRDHLR